jgi:hypothetical protein
VVRLRDARSNAKTLFRHTAYLCVPCCSRNKQQLFTQKKITDWFSNGHKPCSTNFIYNADSSGWSSRRRAGFDPRLVHMRFVVKWHWDRFFSEYSGFPVSFHQCSIIIFIYMLLLPQRRIGGAREFSKKAKPCRKPRCTVKQTGLSSASVATISRVRAAIIFSPIDGN